MRIVETAAARRTNDDEDSCSSSSQGGGICPSCRLAVNKDTGRLKWCRGGNDIWRTRIRYMLLIPAVILPVTIIIIALSKSTVIGKLSMRSSAVSPSPAAPEPKPAALLDQRHYIPDDEAFRNGIDQSKLELNPDDVETSFITVPKPLIPPPAQALQRHKRDMSQGDAATGTLSKRRTDGQLKSAEKLQQQQPRELQVNFSRPTAPPQVRSRQASTSAAAQEAASRGRRGQDCEDDTGTEDEDEEEDDEEDISEISEENSDDEESLEEDEDELEDEEETRAAQHWRTRSASDPFRVEVKLNNLDTKERGCRDDDTVDYRDFWKRSWNEDFIRKVQGKMMLKYMDRSADPCIDFYQYSCGNWNNNNPIPEDHAIYDTFEVLRESLHAVLRQLLEEPIMESENYEGSAILKAKNMFQSCMNYEILEQRMETPLMELLDKFGGWPILKPDWNPKNFDWLDLVAQLRLYNNDILITQSVGPSIQNSDQYIIQLDQTTLGLPSRDYFLEPSNYVYLTAYKNYLIKVVTLLGAPIKTARKQATEMIAFEIKLANITSDSRAERNTSNFYGSTTIKNLRTLIPEIDWYRYLNTVTSRPIDDNQPVALYSVGYLKNLVGLLDKTPRRIVANYVLWRFVRHRVNNLDDRFQEAKQSFYFILYGREKSPSRWKSCVGQVNVNMGLAVGSIFVRKYFDQNSKNDTLAMTHEIQSSFRELLYESDWLDNSTKEFAKEKVDAMRLRIGYPNFILENWELDERYKDVVIHPDKYFENTLNLLSHLTRTEQLRLGTMVNKTQWNEPPAIVNAFYGRNKNTIIFPAGILQPPFYHRYFPRCLNYGGIGVVIGHEITHGFDDKGRLFDKDGNVHLWWNDNITKEFEQRASCLVDQYSRYKVEEVSMHINGFITQGENIADNGGIKQAFRAYEKWLKINGDAHENLPGINATGRQLFFINFAQLWCGSMRPEAMKNKLKTAVHPPGKYRLIGTISNFKDFGKVFNCPVGSPMNPEKKCLIW